MASVRIIHAVTDGKGGRRPRSNRRRAEKPIPVSARKDDKPKSPKPQYRVKRKTPTVSKPKPKSKPRPASVIKLPAPEPAAPALPEFVPPPPIRSGPLAAWEPELAEAILLALAAYNDLRRDDPDLTPVGTI